VSLVALLGLLVGEGHAAPGPADPVLGRIDAALLRLEEGVPIKVLLEVPRGDEARVAAAVRAQGHEVEVATRGRVQLWTTVGALRSIAALDGVRRLRRPHRARAKGELTEGLAVVGVDAWHDQGLLGRGVHIAVLDTEFAGYESLLGDELPEQVETRFLGDSPESGPHGTAVAEIIHDMAPEAALTLYQFEDEGQFLAAVDELMENGEYLVSASVGFDNTWHADGTSVFSEAVDDFTAAGGLWINASGNEAEKYWAGELTDVDGDGWLEFDGAENVAVSGRTEFGASLRWDEPFGAASVDIDLYAYDDPDEAACGAGDNTQQGSDDPHEEVWCVGDQGTISAYDYSGDAAGTWAWLHAPHGLDAGLAVPSGTLTLPADSAAALSVGAVEHSDLSLPAYSSQGPTDDGRTKPDLVAPTSVSTASLGEEAFVGTSAAVPHVTGVAALAFGADRRLSASEVRTMLEESAIDLGESGQDNETGHGLLSVGEAPEGCRRRSCGGCQGAPAGGPLVLVLLALVRRRV